MSMHWPEASLEQYEQARKEIDWEGKPDPKGYFHIAWMADDGFHSCDLWESPEDFQRFADTRMTPVIQRIGIQGQPNIKFSPAHAIFNPSVPMTGRPATRKAARKPARRARPAAKKTAKAKKSAGRSKAAKKKSRR
jgi:hypothetical protein